MGSLSYPTDQVRAIGETIEREIAAIRLPLAIDALTAGRRLDFGDLSIDLDTVTGPKGTLLWADVETLEAHDGKILIKRAGHWLTWSATPVSQIPDVAVLLALARTLHTAHHS